ncbi:MAG: hypothetical protein J3R72DRAFT_436239 [Linnemannia gamsii]|nr:MAG: hypothetical protein J3R72DRAFT_436239 [Linnemannia gamsii]
MSRMTSILLSVLAAVIAILAAGLLYGNDDTDHFNKNKDKPSAVWDPINNSNNNNNQVWEKPPQCSNVTFGFPFCFHYFVWDNCSNLERKYNCRS